MATLKIGIAGAAGRMGRALVRQVAATQGCAVTAASEAPGSDAYGADPAVLAGLGGINVRISDSAKELMAGAEIVLDFTSPEGSAYNATLAAETGTRMVIGTTGLDADTETALHEAAKKTAIVYGANMSIGVNVLLQVTEQVAAILDEEYDIEISEMHHRHKVDAPSGTALAFGRAAAKGRGVDLDAVAQRSRDGVTGERRAGDIGFAVLRGGSVVGEHSVVFAADGERLELTHRATSRLTFARGALRAAGWAHDKPPGVYGMADVLGL